MAVHFSRRKFLRSGAGLLGLAWSGIPFFGDRRPVPALSFSTLGCPDWSFEETLDLAVRYGYKGIELRGIHRQLDLLQCPQFNSATNIKATRRQVEDKGLS